MNRRMFLGLLAAIGAFAAPVVAAEQVLRIGVAPHTSARVILEMYQPLREKLQADLGMPVEIQTAPDFSEYIRRALNREYDIAITTGHQARLLQTDAGYLPLLTYAAEFRSVAVVAKDSPLRRAAELRGATVLALGPTSLVSLWGIHWLETNGVRDVTKRFVSAADSVAQIILAGEAVAGFMSTANFQGLPPDARAGLRIFAQSAPMLGRVYMLNGAMVARRDQILSSLHAFAASPAGARYFESTGLGGYRGFARGEIEAMDPYARDVRAALKASPK